MRNTTFQRLQQIGLIGLMITSIGGCTITKKVGNNGRLSEFLTRYVASINPNYSGPLNFEVVGRDPNCIPYQTYGHTRVVQVDGLGRLCVESIEGPSNRFYDPLMPDLYPVTATRLPERVSER